MIAALNEEATVGPCVEKALTAIRSLGIAGEVLVVDNGSTDRTAETAAQKGARVEREPKKGYGNAYLAGFRAAKGRYLIMGDADDSYNFEEIGPFYDRLREGCDLVVGNRFKGRVEKGAMPFLHRYLGTPVLTGLIRLFFGVKVGDVNCGMRGLTKEALGSMSLKSPGMEFASEMIIKAALVGLKIADIPCSLYRDKRVHKKHLHPWRDGLRHLALILRLACQKYFT